MEDPVSVDINTRRNYAQQIIRHFGAFDRIFEGLVVGEKYKVVLSNEEYIFILTLKEKEYRINFYRKDEMTYILWDHLYNSNQEEAVNEIIEDFIYLICYNPKK